MAGEIEFTANYSDLSTDNGFQFEFRCKRCGNGYRTEFDTFELSTATNVLDGAGGLVGGVFGRAADVAQRAKSAAWEKGSDKAFKKAQEDILPKFVECRRCSAWICRERCWNEKKGLCTQCAPDLGVEMAAAQTDTSVEEVWAHAKMAEEDWHLTMADWRGGITASCPQVRRAAGDEREVLRPVRRRPQGRETLCPVRRQARAGCQVLLRMREPNDVEGRCRVAAEARKRGVSGSSTAMSDVMLLECCDYRCSTACLPPSVLIERGA